MIIIVFFFKKIRLNIYSIKKYDRYNNIILRQNNRADDVGLVGRWVADKQNRFDAMCSLYAARIANSIAIRIIENRNDSYQKIVSTVE